MMALLALLLLPLLATQSQDDHCVWRLTARALPSELGESFWHEGGVEARSIAPKRSTSRVLTPATACQGRLPG